MRALVALLMTCSICAAESRRMILVTPKGVWESVVTDGVPGPLQPIDADVIVQGFDGTPSPNPPKPDPPVSDPIVQQVATVSKDLGSKDEATACAALVDSLSRNGLVGEDFQEALTMGAKIADTSLNANGRIRDWATKATAITVNAAKLKAGIVQAWGLSAASLQSIQHAVENRDADLTGAALDFASIIAILKMVLDLLKSLGVI